MSISSEFKENVQSSDLLSVRSTLVDYLIIDQTFKRFDEALDYALQTLPIIQEGDNALLEEDSLKWNKDYLNRQKASLMVNFSCERIAHIKKVVVAVLPAVATVKTIPTLDKGEIQNKTGRTKLSERTIVSKNSQGAAPKSPNGKEGTPNSKTGKRVISEKKALPQHTQEKSEKEFDPGKALIIGGVVVTTVGVIAVKPMVIGAGVVMVGVGGVIKATDSRNQ